MTQQVQQFADSARLFCSWAESSSSSPGDDALLALHHLSTLYQQALTLPALFGEEESSEVTDGAWQVIYSRFSALPVNYYSQCLNPIDPEADAVGVGDLADDLADIWRDLSRGLSLFNAGHVSAACWEWRQGFWQHWGQHAASGIHALHSWVSEQPQSAT